MLDLAICMQKCHRPKTRSHVVLFELLALSRRDSFGHTRPNSTRRGLARIGLGCQPLGLFGFLCSYLADLPSPLLVIVVYTTRA